MRRLQRRALRLFIAGFCKADVIFFGCQTGGFPRFFLYSVAGVCGMFCGHEPDYSRNRGGGVHRGVVVADLSGQ